MYQCIEACVTQAHNLPLFHFTSPLSHTASFDTHTHTHTVQKDTMAAYDEAASLCTTTYNFLMQWSRGSWEWWLLHTYVSLGIGICCTVMWVAPWEQPWKIPAIRFIGDDKNYWFFSNCIRAWLLADVTAIVVFQLLWNDNTFGDIERGTALSIQKGALLSMFNLLVGLNMSKHYYLMYGNADTIIAMEEGALLRDAKRFKPPTLKALYAAFDGMNTIFRPKFYNMKNIPEGKTLFFVCNHALLGMEMPALVYGVYKERGIFMRGLADFVHFYIPAWCEILKFLGAVRGTREVCDSLMKDGQALLVYPGGAAEVMKKSTDDPYQLKWPEDRVGFARLAVKNGVTIIPTATVGTPDMLDIMYDIPVGFLFGNKGSRKGLTFPLVKPPNPSNVQRVYFSFGDPIDLEQYNGDTSMDTLMKVKNQVKASVEAEIAYLQQEQAKDPDRFLLKTNPSLKDGGQESDGNVSGDVKGDVARQSKKAQKSKSKATKRK
eukprot:GFYU01000919.1.p2 GENE.GFYU01000919.1~~GFYU01000919.1.p2  ORF type:complete len:490 (-),score=108.33 GFYU01000919.1:98-1567(-)